MNLQILNPLEYPNWDELLLTNENYSFFHSSSWARVLSDSYKYKPLYFTSIENGELSALIPVMGIKSLLTGRRGVSLPFTDYCDPIVSDKGQFQEIIEHIIKYGKEAGWKYVHLRGGEGYFEKAQPSASFYMHTLDLKLNEQELLASFRGSTSRNIKKAIKECVHVEICNSLESVKAYYRLHCRTRKEHGLPPQPYYFFKNIYEHVISKKKGFVVLAFYRKREIAGAVYFHFRDNAIYKYGASDRNFQHLRPNNLVMWEAVKWCAKNGFKSFSFGRTEPENEGLLQFKRGWGAKEETLNYYKYDLMQDSFVAEKPKIKSSYGFFRIMPAPILRFTGNILYRHVG